MAQAIEQKILEKLDKIEREVGEIKEHMVDVDSILTEDDYKALAKAEEERKAGKLKTLEDIKRSLKI